MNLKSKITKVVGAGATFATFAMAAAPVAASGYDYYYTSSAADASFGLMSAAIWLCACCVPFLFGLVLGYVVYKDAKKNGVDNPALWGILTFFFTLVGVLVYYLAIKPDAMKKKSPVAQAVEKVKDTVEGEKVD
jgi:hypothetical protein